MKKWILSLASCAVLTAQISHAQIDMAGRTFDVSRIGFDGNGNVEYSDIGPAEFGEDFIVGGGWKGLPTYYEEFPYYPRGKTRLLIVMDDLFPSQIFSIDCSDPTMDDDSRRICFGMYSLFEQLNQSISGRSRIFVRPRQDSRLEFLAVTRLYVTFPDSTEPLPLFRRTVTYGIEIIE